MRHLDDRYLILGLSGRAGAGKDTAADLLCEAWQFYRFAFADALRAEITEAFGVDPGLFANELKEHATAALTIGRCNDGEFIQTMVARCESITSPRSPREIMQLWGTEYRRAQQPRYWIDRAAETLDVALRQGFRRVVLTDVRFVNEAQFIRMHGGKIWHIDRVQARCREAHHQSELEVSAIVADRAISNNRSMTSFATEIMKAYEASHA